MEPYSGHRGSFTYRHGWWRWRRWHDAEHAFPAETFIHIRRERPLDRLFKKIGYCREIQTGDQVFDLSYYLSSATPSLASAWLDQPERRRALDTIFRLGFPEVLIEDRLIRLRKIGGRDMRKTEKGQADLRDLENALATLAGDLPQGADPATDAQSMQRHYRSKGLHMVAGVFIAFCYFWLYFLSLGITERIDTLHWMEAFTYSLSWSLPPVGLVLFLIFRAFRNSDRGHIPFIAYCLVLVPLSCTGGYMAVSLINSRLDSSQIQVQDRRILAVDITHRRRSKNYYVIHAGLESDEAVRRTRVEWNVYDQARPGKNYIRVGIRGGYLGFPWIATKEIVGRPYSTP